MIEALPNYQENAEFKDEGNPTIGTKINPDFSRLIKCEADELAANGAETGKESKSDEPVPHSDLFIKLKTQIQKIDFREAAKLEPDETIRRKHYVVVVIRELLSLAKKKCWQLCVRHEVLYLFNGAYWKKLDEADFKSFLGEVGAHMGVSQIDAEFYNFQNELMKQFFAAANFPTLEPEPGKVLINLQNGTFEITENRQILRPQNPADFLTYQLPYSYEEQAQAPKFHQYLETVLPDENLRKILAEFLGYVFVHPSTLRLEKALLLYGNGANGKSVMFNVVFALLGKENILSHSLYCLTNRQTGYHRADLATKLLNYNSELDGISDRSIFKAMVSCENIEARPIYGRPFNFINTCKFMFNCNELPRETEQTHAFFRRFLIIPFNVTISERDQDKKLGDKIIGEELPGVFNWVLEGLCRLLQQQGFTYSEISEEALRDYREQSDSVQMFLKDHSYSPDTLNLVPLKEIFPEYKVYCSDCNYRPVSNKTFADRLRAKGFTLKKEKYGMGVYVKKDFL